MYVNKVARAFSAIHMIVLLFPREYGVLGFQYARHTSLVHAHE
jgi:hypothetical protein